MSETLKSIMDSYRSTPNIQVIEKKLANEIIQSPDKLIGDFVFSTFKNSDLINMEFIRVNFESSYFEKCLIENCIFEKTIFLAAEFENCVFKNCLFIHCNLSEVDGTETIFNECTFLKSGLSNAIFESCHFMKPMFEGMKDGLIGSAVLIDSKFSNSKKSIEFKEEVYFQYVLDQLNEFFSS
ncbi:MAG: hypothetical protein ACI85O_003905 [Saprospiraceae bacterium]|jgi:uncharacterized protein YjbI with pentapeptide repeats